MCRYGYRVREMPGEVTGAGQGWFAGSGAVGRYWLAHSVGFEIYSGDGRVSGVVAGVELDRTSGGTATLLVERRHGRPLRLPVSSVTHVDPWQRAIVVELPSSRPAGARVRAASGAAARGGQAAVRGGRVAVRGGEAAWARAAAVGPALVAGAAAARRAAQPSRRSALWLGTRTAYALAFVGWLYGAALFVVSRAAVRVLLATLSVLAVLGVRAAPPLGRSARAAARRAGRAGSSLRGRAARVRRPQHPQRRPSHGRQI